MQVSFSSNSMKSNDKSNSNVFKVATPLAAVGAYACHTNSLLKAPVKAYRNMCQASSLAYQQGKAAGDFQRMSPAAVKKCMDVSLKILHGEKAKLRAMRNSLLSEMPKKILLGVSVAALLGVGADALINKAKNN